MGIICFDFPDVAQCGHQAFSRETRQRGKRPLGPSVAKVSVWHFPETKLFRSATATLAFTWS